MFGSLLGIDLMGGGASAPNNMPVPKDTDYSGFIMILGITIIFTLICFIIYYFRNEKDNNDDDERE